MTPSAATPPLPAPSATSAPPSRLDFPAWLPPMLVKELRQGLRTRGFVGSFIVLQVVMVVAFVWALATTVGVGRNAFTTVNGFFWTLLGLWLLAITPMHGMAALRQEIDARTLDLLMLTRLTGWRIVLGKWGSLMTQAALVVVALLPYAVVRYFFGSVNLLEDVQVLTLLFAGSALLTAIALWAGSFGKLVRVLLPVGAFLFLQGFGMSRMSRALYTMGMGGRGASSPSAAVFGGAGGPPWWLVSYDGLLLLAFFLVNAVRRIAPPAENHAPWGRLLAIAALLPGFALLRAPRGVAEAQFVFGLLAILVVCATELASVRTPWAVHLQPWLRRGPLLEWFGRFWLPGWPSAAAFAALAGALAWGACFAMGARAGVALWIVTLAWVALVFPAIVVALLPNARRFAVATYFGLHGCFGILCIFLASSGRISATQPWLHTLDIVSQMLPVASFWLTLRDLDKYLSPPGFLIWWHVAVSFVVMVAAWWAARPYWRQVLAHTAQVRDAANTEERV